MDWPTRGGYSKVEGYHGRGFKTLNNLLSYTLCIGNMPVSPGSRLKGEDKGLVTYQYLDRKGRHKNKQKES